MVPDRDGPEWQSLGCVANLFRIVCDPTATLTPRVEAGLGQSVAVGACDEQTAVYFSSTVQRDRVVRPSGWIRVAPRGIQDKDQTVPLDVFAHREGPIDDHLPPARRLAADHAIARNHHNDRRHRRSHGPWRAHVRRRVRFDRPKHGIQARYGHHIWIHQA